MAVLMEEINITGKTRAIICFGPATDVTGSRPAEYYQVVIDPDMVSPGGDYIRFDSRIEGCEVHGWQRVAMLTICEILQTGPDDPLGQGVTMKAIKKE